MGVVVNGNAADRAAVEKLLQQLCSLVTVDPKNGLVIRNPGPTADLGCCCLDNLIGSNFITTITPLAGPGTAVPGTGKTIGDYCGGSTTIPAGGMKVAGAGGQQVNGAGAGAAVHIDISDNNGAGYHVFDGNGQQIDDPAFVYLYHELCTGHATQSIQGAANPNDLETDVIKCETKYLDAQQPKYTQRVGSTAGKNAAGAKRPPR
jgi:hypothetical protein